MAAFMDALVAYQPNLQSLVSSPQTLSLALDAVSEPTSLAGRKPVVLYITSIPAAGRHSGSAKPDPACRGRAYPRSSSGLWPRGISSPHSGVTALKDLAIQTGGQVVLFSGDGAVAQPGRRTSLLCAMPTAWRIPPASLPPADTRSRRRSVWMAGRSPPHRCPLNWMFSRPTRSWLRRRIRLSAWPRMNARPQQTSFLPGPTTDRASSLNSPTVAHGRWSGLRCMWMVFWWTKILPHPLTSSPGI